MISSIFISGNQDLSEPFEIRREVFINEQKCPEKEEYDSFDKHALHLLIYAEETPAATGRIYHDGTGFRIGKISVLKQFRGRQIGDLAVRLLLYKAFSSGAQSVNISAQKYIVPLYEKFGFKKYGEEYTEAGIPHVAMKVGKNEVVYPSACNK